MTDADYRAAWLAYWGRGGWTPAQLAESTANQDRMAAEIRTLRAENAELRAAADLNRLAAEVRELRAENADLREQLRKHPLEPKP